MPVSDIVRENVVTVESETSLRGVARRMQETNVRSVVVVEERVPIGLVSGRDLALAVLNDANAGERPIQELIGDEVVTVDADYGIYELVELFSTKGIQRVPVVENGDLVGIVSLSDVVVLLGMELQHVANAIRTIGPAYERSPIDLYD